MDFKQFLNRFVIWKMQFFASFRPQIRAILPLALGTLFFLSHTASAGEKIQFSDPENKTDLPAQGLNLDRFTRPDSPFRRDPSAANLVAPLPRNNNIDPKKVEELLDRQKSWLSPDATDEEKLRRIFNIRENSLDGRNSKRIQSLDLLEKTPQQKPPGTDNSPGSFDAHSDDSWGKWDEGSFDLKDEFGSFGPDMKGIDAGNAIAGPDLNSLLDANKPRNEFSRMRDQWLGKPSSNFMEADTERVSSRPKFAFDNETHNPLPSVQDWIQRDRISLMGLREPSRLNSDPIHFERDSTQNPLQPFRGNRFMEDSESERNDFSPRMASEIGGIPRAPSSALDALKARELNPTSLSPAFTLPETSSPLIRPKPAVLELPRRKF
jgi:hypothetical protein